MLSQTLLYPAIRTTGAILASVAAMAWVFERVTENSNPISLLIEKLFAHGPQLIISLAVFAIVSMLVLKLRVDKKIGGGMTTPSEQRP
jgi:hypothetical protein